LHPTHVNPVELAWLSRNYQPRHCLITTAPTPIDYSGACSTGPEPRKRPPHTCGPRNPCCFDCKVYTYVPPTRSAPPRPDYANCADGVAYWSDGETQVDSRYTLRAPAQTAGEWNDEQRVGQAETTARPTGGAGKAGSDGMGSVATWMMVMAVILVGLLGI
jgi:hypothetical protein